MHPPVHPLERRQQIYYILTLRQTLQKTEELQSQAGPGLCSFQPKPGRPATDQRYLTTCETVQLRSEPLKEFTLEVKTVS